MKMKNIITTSIILLSLTAKAQTAPGPYARIAVLRPFDGETVDFEAGYILKKYYLNVEIFLQDAKNEAIRGKFLLPPHIPSTPAARSFSDTR